MRLSLALLALCPLACSGDSAAAARRTPGKVLVCATTGMVADLARRVGGDRVEVDGLMGPGVDPHLFKASARDVDRLRRADLILYNGLGLEGKMGDLFVQLKGRREVVPVTEAIPPERLLEPEELQGHYDPHVWFDVGLWAETPAVVARALARVDPGHAAEYAARAEAYAAELRRLHEEVRVAIASIPKERRVLVTSHDAFRYFGRAYDVEVAGLQGISTVSEAGVQDVQRVVDLVVARGVKAIFVETSVNDAMVEKVIQTARERGHALTLGGRLYSDAMGDTPPEDTYAGMVRANVRRIVEALR
jgi:manganese/zinc/iron transport system substrate-binding protein